MPVLRLPVVGLLILLVAACSGGGAPASNGSPDAVADTLLAVNGTRLFVHREGAGEPMVVIHGGPLLDHGYMVEPLRRLADDVALVFHDQRLSGRSDGNVDSASVRLAAFADDVEGIRHALGLDRVHVLGHSWGGLIAMKYAAMHADRVRSLILVSPMPPTAALWREAEQTLAASLTPADTAGVGALRASPEMANGSPGPIEQLLRLSFRSQFHDPGGVLDLEFHIADDHAERSRQFGRVMVDLLAYDMLAELRSLRVPVLVVYGESETGVGPGIDALRAALADVQIVAIEEAGHFAFIEQPVAFEATVRRFLERVAEHGPVSGTGAHVSLLSPSQR
jgi:proline iminopeptidase